MKSFVLILPLLLFLLQGPERYAETKICISTEEQKLYNLLMEYRKEKKLESIPLSAKLTMVAQIHAKDLSENYKPFDGPCNLHSWSKKGKWQSCCYTDDHKQAACMWSKPKEIAGYQSDGYEISYYNGGGVTAQEGIDGWKESTGHNQVIINEGIWKSVKWNAIGIGLYKEYGVVWFGKLEDTTKPSACD